MANLPGKGVKGMSTPVLLSSLHPSDPLFHASVTEPKQKQEGQGASQWSSRRSISRDTEEGQGVDLES